jgi:endo-1,4-beta-xylanase
MVERPRSGLTSICIIACLAGAAAAACTGSVLTNEPDGSGGASPGSGGSSGKGGATATGQGGSNGTAGATGAGGAQGVGGAVGVGGALGIGGKTGAGGRTGTGGVTGTAGATGMGGAGGTTIDCAGALPTTGATVHTSMNQSGGTGATAWSIWTNTAPGTITTYTAPAFAASWTNSGDYLARLGFEWGNSGKTFDTFGTITADFAETKTGTAGGFSYIGIYGWSTNPCIEYYIVEDSYNRMPVNPGNTMNKGTAMIDGGTYTLYTRPTTGTGGSRCGASVGSWTQFYSVRQTARSCGTISITEHFKAWAAAGMTLGNMLEAKILIETGGGTGSINFTTASVTAQ